MTFSPVAFASTATKTQSRVGDFANDEASHVGQQMPSDWLTCRNLEIRLDQRW
jgi:hypothetical protein